jgi:hypothetical protein
MDIFVLSLIPFCGLFLGRFLSSLVRHQWVQPLELDGESQAVSPAEIVAAGWFAYYNVQLKRRSGAQPQRQSSEGRMSGGD